MKHILYDIDWERRWGKIERLDNGEIVGWTARVPEKIVREDVHRVCKDQIKSGIMPCSADLDDVNIRIASFDFVASDRLSLSIDIL